MLDKRRTWWFLLGCLAHSEDVVFIEDLKKAREKTNKPSTAPVDHVVVVIGFHLVLDGCLQVANPLESQLQVHLQTLISRLEALNVHFLVKSWSLTGC